MQSGSLPYSGYSQASEHGRIRLYQWDCMELLKQTPDNYYGLCIVDPPYGMENMTAGGRGISGWTSHVRKSWDGIVPDAKYFDELRRVSCDQIVWGANYMTEHLPASMGWIFWDKGQRDFSLADGELAWTSFRRALRVFEYARWSANQEAKIHPTQKPVALYRWLLKNYAKPGQKILDTHGGSMSIAIACDIEGYDLTLCELDPDYFAAGKKRLEQHQAQPRLFDAPTPQPVQLTL